MLTYLVLYFLVGLPCSILFKIVLSKNTLRGWLALTWIWPLWPLIAVAVIINYVILLIVWFRTRQCAWCGLKLTARDAETWKAHALVCQKHPLALEIKELKDELKELHTAMNGTGFTLYYDRGQVGLRGHGTIYMPLEKPEG